MLKNTVLWRKDFGIESLVEEDPGIELDKVVFMHGFDKEGHPVCYNAYGEIQFLEKSIRKPDFSPDGICTFVQVNDLKNSPGPFKRELRTSTNQALQLIQDNYPEFVAKQKPIVGFDVDRFMEDIKSRMGCQARRHRSNVDLGEGSRLIWILGVGVENQRSDNGICGGEMLALNKAKALKVLCARLYEMERSRIQTSRSKLRSEQIGSGAVRAISHIQLSTRPILDHRVGIAHYSKIS
ncbi:Patellin-3 [Camellia lanceoleosa]|uniref:Patellin-3 n=1 Tax=Camellia lanceoleosa TaxID=1840588 RepID=A0ACC0HLA2_9ERIC|nr:Patellin-3 [Camellia lanceoleosa]